MAADGRNEFCPGPQFNSHHDHSGPCNATVESPVIPLAERSAVVSYQERGTRFFAAGRPVLEEWTRQSFSSLVEEDWWDAMIKRASAAWQEIERWSVVDGVRPAARINVTAEELPERTLWAAKHGLILQPMGRFESGNHAISVKASSSSKAWSYMALLTTPDRLVQSLQAHWNDEEMGKLLGYPECCRQRFIETWGSGQVDSTYDQYASTIYSYEHFDDFSKDGAGPRTVITNTANGPVEANLLWRWQGIRWVPHLPCSFTCEPSIRLGNDMRDVALRHGFIEEAAVIDEILRWPVKWSAIFGIAEIVGPCVKISTRTDWHHKMLLFEREGVYNKPTKALWTKNGFTSAKAMLTLHDPLLAELRQDDRVPANASVLDLGCGNGLLMQRLKRLRPDVKIGGVDADMESPPLQGRWLRGRIQDGLWPAADVLLVSVAHLLDMPEEDRLMTLQHLASASTLVTYGYEDCLRKFGPITTMCQKAGLPVPTVLPASNDKTQVGLIRRAQ